MPLIDMTEKREGLPEMDDSIPCPRCIDGENKGLNIDTGFGLAGGGFGPYTYCNDCGGIVSKTCEPIDE